MYSKYNFFSYSRLAIALATVLCFFTFDSVAQVTISGGTGGNNICFEQTETLSDIVISERTPSDIGNGNVTFTDKSIILSLSSNNFEFDNSSLAISMSGGGLTLSYSITTSNISLTISDNLGNGNTADNTIRISGLKIKSVTSTESGAKIHRTGGDLDVVGFPNATKISDIGSVSPPSFSNAGTNQTKCNNGNFTLSGNNPTSGTGSWTILGALNGASITTPNSPTSTVTGLNSGKSITLIWTIRNGSCPARASLVTLRNQSLPTPSNAGSDQTKCNNGNFTLSGNNPTSGSGTWRIAGVANGATIDNTTSNTSDVTGLTAGKSVTLRWSINNGTCTESTDDVTLTNDKLPTGDISGVANICHGSSTNLTFNLTGKGPFSVAYSDGTSTFSLNNIANGANISVSPNSTTTYTLTKVVDLGTGASCEATNLGTSVTITVNPNPTLTITNTKSSICSGGTTNITLNSPTPNHTITVTSIDYQAVTGGSVAVNNTFTDGKNITETLENPTDNPITVTYGFRVTTTDGCPVGTNPEQTTTVIVAPRPDMSISNNATTICSGSSTDITLNSSETGAVIKLTDVTGTTGVTGFTSAGVTYSDGEKITDNLVNTTNAPVTIIYEFSVSIGNCASNTATYSTPVTINPNPTLTITNTKSSICSGGTTNITLNSPTSNHTITVTSIDYQAVTGGSVAVNNTFTDGQNITETLENPTDNPITVTYGFKVTTTDGCPVGTNPEQTTTVIVAPRPDMSISNNATTICSGSSTDITLNSSETGAVIKLTDVTGTTGVTGFTSAGVTYSDGEKITDNLVNTTNAPVTITYEFSVSIGNCASNTATYSTSVTINPNPTLTITNTKNSICSGGTSDITLNSPTSNHTITVTSIDYQAVTGGSVAVNNTFTDGKNITETLENPTDNPITVTYGFKVTTTDGCPVSTNPEQTTTVIVAPRPDMSISNNATTICSGSSTDIILNSSEAGAVIKLKAITGTTGVTGFTSVGVTFSDGGKITDKLVNTTNAPVTITYEFSVSIGNCASNTATYSTSVTVNPNPTLTITNTKSSICSGGTSDITLNSPTPNHTITVTSIDYQAVTGGSVAVNNTFTDGKNITETLENPTDNPITVTYGFKVTTTDGCPVGTNPEQTTTVIVAPRPDMSISNNATTICSGSSTDITLNSSEAGAVIKLKAITGTTGVTGFTSARVTYSDGEKITDNLVNTTNAPVTITYEFSVSIGNCASNTATYSTSVTINPNPTLTITNAKNSICSGGTSDITLNSPTPNHTITVTSIDYQAVTGGSVAVNNTFTDGKNITETLENPTDNPITVTYGFKVTTTDGCPVSTNPEQTTTVIVAPRPDMSISNNATTICSGSSTDIILNSSEAGAVIKLKAITGTTGVTGFTSVGVTFSDGGKITDKLVNTTNAPVTITYEFSVSIGNCASNTATYSTSVTVNPNPTLTITNTKSSICSGGTTNITLNSPTPNHTITVTSIDYQAVTGGSVAVNNTFTDGKNITETLENPTDNPITVTYGFKVTTTDGCPVGTNPEQTTTVIVAPRPDMSISNNATTICSGSSTDITLNSSETGAVIKLTDVTGTTGVTGFTSAGVTYSDGEKITDNLVNTTNAPVTIIYEFSVSIGNCASNTATYSTPVTINPNPTLTITNTKSSICSGGTTNITLNSPTSNHTITVTSIDYQAVTGGSVAVNNTFTDGQNITETLENPTDNPITVTYGFKVTTTDGCPVGTNPEQTTTVIVAPRPDMSISNNATTICSGSSTDITLNSSETGAVIKLTDVTGTTGVTGFTSAGVTYSDGEKITDNLVNTTNAPVTITYEFSVSIGNCASNTATYSTSVTINPNPTLTITNTKNSICSGGTSDITLNSPTSNHTITVTSIDYQAVTGGSVAVNNTFTDGKNITETLENPTDNPITVTYGFKVTTTDGCPVSTNPEQTTTVIVAPRPDMSISNNATTICSGSSTDIILNSSEAGAVIKLKAITGTTGVTGFTSVGVTFSDGGKITDKLVNTTNAPVTITYEFSVSIGNCASNTATYSTSVTVNPNPTLTITNTKSSICSGGTSDITLNSPTPNHTITVTSIDYQAVTGGSVAVNNTFTDGKNITETLENPTDNPITVTYGFKVTTTDGCPVGTNPEQTTTVIVAPRPDMSISNNATTICSGSSTDITLNSSEAGAVTKLKAITGTTGVTGFTSAGVTYSDGEKITDNLVNTTNAPVTITYEFSVSIGNCASNTATYSTSVTVNPNPTLTITNTKSSICSGGTSDITLNSPTPNHTITVTSIDYGAVNGGSVAVNNTFANGQNITETLENPTDNPITVTYGFKVTTTDGCPVVANPEQTTTVIVAPRPDMSISNNATTICSGSSTDITLNSSETGAVIKLKAITGTTGVTGFTSAGVTYSDGEKITDNLVNTTNAPVTITYEFSVSIGNCASNTATYSTSVTINPNPTLTITNTKSSICSGGTTNITLNSPTPNHTITVTSIDYQAVTGGSVAVNNTFANGQNITETLENPTDNPITVTYGFKVTTTDGCPVSTNPEQTTTVIVAPRPDMSISNNATTICSGSPTDITLNSSETGAVIKLKAITGTTGMTGFTSARVTYSDGEKITDNLVNTTNAPVTITYEFSVSIGNCASNTATYSTSVTINPNPTLTITNAKNSICSGETTNITLNSPTPNHTITVTSIDYQAVTGGSVAVNNTFTDGKNIAETLENPTDNPITVTYGFKVTTADGCPVVANLEQTTTVIVAPRPDMSISNNATTICSGSSTDITLNSSEAGAVIKLKAITGTTGVTGFTSAGVTYSDGEKITDNLVNTTNAPVAINYEFSVSIGNCASNTATYSTSVTINPNPTLTITNTKSSICSGETTNITLNSPTNDHQIRVVSVDYGGGNITGGNISTGNTFIDGDKITETLINTTSSSLVAIYTFQILTPSTTPTCPLTPKEKIVKVTVLPLPQASANDQTVCSGETITIPISNEPNNVQGVTFTWTATGTANVVGYENGDGSTIRQILKTTDNTIGLVAYTITPKANGCTGPIRVVRVTINPLPTVNAGADYSVCEPNTINLSGTIGGSATSGTWSLVSGGSGVVSTSNTIGTTVTATYTVTQGEFGNLVFNLVTDDPDGAGPCSVAEDQLTVKVNQKPTVTVPADFVVCQPASITIKGTIGGSASSGVWSIVSGDGTLSVSSNTGNEVSAIYTPTTTDVGSQVVFMLKTNDPDLGGPCDIASEKLNVTINKSPIMSAGADLSVCEDAKEVQLQGSFGGSVTQVQWSGGAGSFDNPSLPNAIYTFDQSEIGKTVTLTLTSNDPDDTGPCESITDKVNVKINRLPSINFFGLPTTRAQNAGKVEIIANKEGGIFSIQPFTPALTNLPTSAGQLHKASFDPAVAKVTTYTITYTYNDPNTGCQNNISKPIEVLPVTSIDWTVDKVVSIGGTFGRQEVCAETGKLRLKGIPAVATGQTGTLFESQTPGLVALESDGFYYMNTNGLSSATYEIKYTYVNDVGAISVLNKKINVHASPNVAINVLNACIKDDIKFNDATTVPQSNFFKITPFTASVSAWNWDFDDRQTSSKAKNPKHRYSKQGAYDVILIATTEKGCSAKATKRIRVGPVPIVDFKWTSICNGEATDFIQNVQSGISTVTEYEWTFGAAGDSKVKGAHRSPIQAPNNNNGRTTGTFDHPKHKYTNFGTYNVNLKIKTNDGCIKDSTKKVFILPYKILKPTAQKAYTEDFESDNGGWVATADYEGAGPNQYRSDTSWVWGVPTSKNINSPGNKAWWTGKNIIKTKNPNADYPESESSYVNGPCFNLSALNRPMVSFDIWVDLQESFDGVVAQYSLDGGITWLNVGTINKGLNWYDGQNIVGMTHNQLLGRYGWTKPTGKWVTARFGLEDIPKEKRNFVRFRIAFGTDASTPTNETHSGFAFDNIFIGEKTRHVLLEHFTNASPGGQGTNDFIYNLFDKQQNNTNDSVNFIILQYHLGVPAFDQLYADNEAEQNARSLFYGFDKTPNSILDGLPVFSGFAPNKINSTAIDSLALKTPTFEIKIDTIRSDKNTLNIKTILKANKDFSQDLILNVAIVENQITLNGKSYRYVFRKLLYGSDGFVISNSWKIGQELESSASWTINKKIYNAKNLAIIAFVQNRQTKEVYQAGYLKAQPKQSPPITGVNSPLNSSIRELKLYPNPVNNELTIAPPRRLEGHFTWQIVDQRGVKVLSGDMKFSTGREHKIDTSSVPNGVYYVVVGKENHPAMYRKIVIANRY